MTEKTRHGLRSRMRGMLIHNHLLRRIFGLDRKGRGFLRKYIFSWRSVVLLLIAYVAFFLKKNLIQLLPWYTKGQVSLGNFSTNFTDTLILENLVVHKTKAERYDVTIKVKKAIFDIARQQTGNRLLAIKHFDVQSASVEVKYNGRRLEPIKPESGGFDWLLDTLQQISDILLTEEVSYALQSIDFSLDYTGSQEKIDFIFRRITGTGRLTIDSKKFCPQLNDTTLTYLDEVLQFSTTGCIYSDFLEYRSPKIRPLINTNETLNNVYVKVFPYLKGESSGKVKIGDGAIRLKRVFNKGNMPILEFTDLEYSFEPMIESLDFKGQVSYKPITLQLKSDKSNSQLQHLSWQIDGGDNSAYNTLLTIMDIPYRVPEKIIIQHISADGQHWISKKVAQKNILGEGTYSGQVTAKASVLLQNQSNRHIRMYNKLKYKNSDIEIEQLHLDTFFGDFYGSGYAGPTRGWNVDLVHKLNYDQPIEFEEQFLLLSGENSISIHGPFRKPEVAFKFQTSNSYWISKQKFRQLVEDIETQSIALKKQIAKQEPSTGLSRGDSQIEDSLGNGQDVAYNDQDVSDVEDPLQSQPLYKRIGRFFDIRLLYGQKEEGTNVQGLPETDKQEIEDKDPEAKNVDQTAQGKMLQNLSDSDKDERLANPDRFAEIEWQQYHNQLREKSDFTYYNLWGNLDLSLDQQLWVLQGNIFGFTSRKDEIKNEQFAANIEAMGGENKALSADISIHNFRYQNKALNFDFSLQGISFNKMEWHFSNISYQSNNHSLISHGSIYGILDQKKMAIEAKLRESDALELTSQAELYFDDGGVTLYDISVISTMRELSYLRAFDQPIAKVKGSLHLDLVASNAKGAETIAYRLYSDRLYPDKKIQLNPDDYIQLNWNFLSQNGKVKQSISCNQVDGYIHIQTDNDAQLSLQNAILSVNVSDAVRLMVKSSHFSLDRLNPFIDNRALKSRYQNAFINSNLSAFGRYDKMQYLGQLSITAEKFVIFDNEFNNIDISLINTSDLMNFDLYAESGAGFLRYQGEIRAQRIYEPWLSGRLKSKDFTLYLDNKTYIAIDLKDGLLGFRYGRWNITGTPILHDGKIFVDDNPFASDAKKLRIQANSGFEPSVTLPNWDIDLRFQLGDNIWLRSALGSFELTGQSHLLLSRQRSDLSGILTVNRGALYIQNNEFTVEDASLTVNGFNPKNYIIYLEARTELPGTMNSRQGPLLEQEGEDIGINSDLIYDIYLTVKGPLSQPELDFVSDPSLSRDQVLTGLALGRVVPQGGGSDFARTSTAAAFNLYSDRWISNVERRAGFVDNLKLKVHEEKTANQNNQVGAQFTAGKYLAKRLYVKYDTGVRGGHNVNSVTAEYNLTKWLKAVGSTGQDEEQGKEKWDGRLLVNFNY